MRFCRILPLQIFLAIWTWSQATLLAKGEVFFSRYCLQTRPQWIFTSKSWIWVRFCRVLPLQIFPAFWTWSLGTLLAKVKFFLKLLPPNQASMNFYIQILDLSEVLQGITIENISGYLNLKSSHSFGQRWSFFSRYCLQTRSQWIFTSKSWIWVRFCRVLPLQIFPAIWTWSQATLLAKGEVFSQDIASKPSLNEFLHPNLGFEWSFAGYCHYKYIWLFDFEV